MNIGFRVAGIGEAHAQEYIGVMNHHPIQRRLLTAIAAAAGSGGIAYGLTAWLAPPSVSANWVAAIVAAITALAILAPVQVLRALTGSERGQSSKPDSYYDASFSIHKDEGWND